MNRRYNTNRFTQKKPGRKRIYASARAGALMNMYGLTLMEYDRMLAEQDYHCAICPCLPVNAPKQRLNVDHHHATGTVRGLLCANCNIALGHFREDPELMRNAIAYLAKWPELGPTKDVSPEAQMLAAEEALANTGNKTEGRIKKLLEDMSPGAFCARHGLKIPTKENE